MDNEIFTEIMNLIESKTDMPLTILNLRNWIKNSEKNKKIYEIYTMASDARDLEE